MLSYGTRAIVGLLAFALFALEPAISAAQQEYRLASGDRVRVIVYGEDDLSGEYEVDGVGSFSMPLIGVVAADELTLRELERSISEALKDGFLKNPQVSAEVLNYRPFYIIGEVNSPGSYPYRSGMTVISAVAVAGGYTFRADEDDILIKRGGEAAVELDAEPGTVVLPGDIVRIKERFF